MTRLRNLAIGIAPFLMVWATAEWLWRFSGLSVGATLIGIAVCLLASFPCGAWMAHWWYRGRLK